MRFKYDKAKSERLKKDLRRRIGFEEVKEIWTHYHLVTLWKSTKHEEKLYEQNS